MLCMASLWWYSLFRTILRNKITKTMKKWLCSKSSLSQLFWRNIRKSLWRNVDVFLRFNWILILIEFLVNFFNFWKNFEWFFRWSLRRDTFVIVTLGKNDYSKPCHSFPNKQQINFPMFSQFLIDIAGASAVKFFIEKFSINILH